jgi:glyoxylase-like metal-dependent hydrolase (beta-lactamase superfamily II)/rhodanese-related sulfurtransferase
MYFRQYYLGCLSHASYLIGDETTGRAVVVDPQRDVDEYLADAAEAGLTVERVVETHFHADFVSGHLELADRTGATIWYGEGAEADFPIGHLHDGERLRLGEVEIEVRATPGHTPESISLVVYEHAGDPVPYGVLTGDTLFIGDVGRPDLLSSEGVTADDLARHLYHSLHEKLLTLPHATRVFPAHGAGSACGKSLSTETVSTIGEQRRANYALAPMTEDEFVALVTEGQPAAPAYFPYSAHRNRERHPLLGEHEPPARLTVDEVLAVQAAGGVVLDTRSVADFAAGHLAGSVNVPRATRLAEYTGNVVRPDQPVVAVCDDGAELEVRVRLGRIGFDNLVGVLADPALVFQQREDLVVRSSRLTVAELRERQDALPDLVVVDVRNAGERALGAIPGSVHLPLASLLTGLRDLDPAHRRLLRQRQPLLDRDQHPGRPRVRRRERPPGRLHGVVGGRNGQRPAVAANSSSRRSARASMAATVGDPGAVSSRQRAARSASRTASSSGITASTSQSRSAAKAASSATWSGRARLATNATRGMPSSQARL